MRIDLPTEDGARVGYEMRGVPLPHTPMPPKPARVVYAAAHVVADPFADSDPASGAIDWAATLAFRRHLAGLGLGIAEAMDTAQRGMGLGWPGALELISQTLREVPEAQVFNGIGTDHVSKPDGLDAVARAYLEQLDAVQTLGGRVIVMASRALAAVATGPEAYLAVYRRVLAAADRPVILHWLGEMFDPQLAGYWGHADLDAATDTVIALIEERADKIDGIKISLLDKAREVAIRRRLPAGVRMYTGDDFNYPALIAGDDHGHSDALLGVFDPLAPLAAQAIGQLSRGDVAGFHATLDPTLPLARLMFCAPTQHYKSGVVFLAWLNGFQDHFVMLGGAQAARPLPYYTGLFRAADRLGLFRDPEKARDRMTRLLALYGF
ncbi:MAG: dihydrodipicolinate synthase family protein [Pseudomonadota bacterium]